MGSKGSLHCRTHKVEAVVSAICEEYSKADSYLNKDNTHNGHGKPFVVVGENFISIYDGSFAVYGDLQREAKLLAERTDAPVMGVTNANGDLASILVARGDALLMEALFVDGEWEQELDVEMLGESMSLPFPTEDLRSLLTCEEGDEFISLFHQQMQIPYFLYQDETLSKYHTLTAEFPNIAVYTQTKPYAWEEDFSYIV